MKYPMSLPVLLLLVAVLPVTAGDDKAKTRLKDLQTRAAKHDFDNDKLRRDLLSFAREHVGTPLYPATMDALRAVPSPLDRLDEKAIDAEDRKLIAIPELVGFVQAHGRAVAHVAISLDGAFLATSGWDNLVHIHKLGDKTPKSWAKVEGSLSGIAFSPDSKLLATGSRQTRVIGWDLTGEKPVEKESLQGHKSRPFVLAFSPNGKMLASGSSDPVVRVWKMGGAEPEGWATLANDKSDVVGVSSLAFSHDGKYLVAGSLLGKESLAIWDASGAFLDDRLIPAANARVIVCSPTAPVIAFAGDDAEIHLWNIGAAKIERLHKLPGHPGKAGAPLVKALAFSPDGKVLASAGQDQRVRLWDVSKGEKLREWQLLDEPRALAFSSDSRHLAIGNGDGTLYLLRLESVKISAK